MTNSSSKLGEGRSVLMLVQNCSLPTDKRVWAECLALRDEGFEVVAVAPEADGPRERDRWVDGIEVHRFRMRESSGGALGYLREYASAMWQIRQIVRQLARERSFDVVHAANPPDFLLLAARSLQRRGARMIFDHHDLAPELYLSRFGDGRHGLYWPLRALERASFTRADVVISTNESYRRVALKRGGKRPDRVFVVRNGPQLARFRGARPDPSLRRGKPYLLVYHGVMGPQDGIDHALRALAILKDRRQDWHAAFLGSGDMEAELRGLRDELGLQEMVEFTGWAEDEQLLPYLATADVGLAPEPKSALNDQSTMIKIGEYLAMGLPVVAYDLTESRVSAEGAAVYATPDAEDSFAACIDALLDDPKRREAMSAEGRARAIRELSWEHSLEQLRAAYASALDGSVARPRTSGQVR